MAVVVETTIGDFTVDLYTEERPQSKCEARIEVKLFYTIGLNESLNLVVDNAVC